MGLLNRFLTVREHTEEICRPLAADDYGVQSMPDASPAKWHLAHTSWFYENFILLPLLPGYQAFHPRFNFLFNSYYESVGEHVERAKRGMLSRPTTAVVLDYRHQVDRAMKELLGTSQGRERASDLTELGLNHEQQHQELLLTDLKHALGTNPLRPAYSEDRAEPEAASEPLRFLALESGLRWIGHSGSAFSFDNEKPEHQVFLEPSEVASRLVTVGEYFEFIRAGGYRDPSLWLSDGWALSRQENWWAPLYWEGSPERAHIYGWAGVAPVESLASRPVAHVSYFEAAAYARWRSRRDSAPFRLATEQEWETAANQHGQAFRWGDLWEWTSSAYLPYPGFRSPDGALGEYNGKFMCNQMVLRGASHGTPLTHRRLTYRNFFSPGARWQFSGIRLASESRKKS